MIKFYLEQYYEEIKSGNIIVGLELKTEIQKLIKDLKDPRYGKRLLLKLYILSKYMTMNLIDG